MDYIVVDGELARYYGTEENVCLPDTVDTVRKKSFSPNSTIHCVEIPKSVTYIGDEAFCNCKGLKRIIIHGGNKKFRPFSFYNCTELKDVYFEGTLREWMSLNIFPNGSPLFQFANLYINGELLTDLVTPEEVYEIEPSAFSRCSSLKSVLVRSDIYSIGEGAFLGCEALKSAIIKDEVEIIGEGAFYSCAELETVVLGEGIKSIGKSAFDYCPSLKTIAIPDSVEQIEKNAFDKNTTLLISKQNKIAKKYAQKNKINYIIEKT